MKFEQSFKLHMSVHFKSCALHLHLLLSHDFLHPHDKNSKIASGAGDIVIQSITNWTSNIFHFPFPSGGTINGYCS